MDQIETLITRGLAMDLDLNLNLRFQCQCQIVNRGNWANSALLKPHEQEFYV
jgi:hypothetical protein